MSNFFRQRCDKYVVKKWSEARTRTVQPNARRAWIGRWSVFATRSRRPDENPRFRNCRSTDGPFMIGTTPKRVVSARAESRKLPRVMRMSVAKVRRRALNSVVPRDIFINDGPTCSSIWKQAPCLHTSGQGENSRERQNRSRGVHYYAQLTTRYK